jgi:hypothetical protein
MSKRIHFLPSFQKLPIIAEDNGQQLLTVAEWKQLIHMTVRHFGLHGC